MKKISLYSCILVILGMSILSGCSDEFARRADGTCVLLCGNGGAAGTGTAGG